MTVPLFQAAKGRPEPLSMLTAYDHLWAGLLDEAGVDSILVGDSLAMVVQGRTTTLPVTLDQMIYHAEMVCRAVRSALVIVDLPFMTFHASTEDAIRSAGRVLKETGAQAVKLEGGANQADMIAALSRVEIPVMAHVGLKPQNVHKLGGYKMQRDGDRLLAEAIAAEQAGAFAVLLECVPAAVAERITKTLKVPTIGIGAGTACDGQVLVTQDMLGLTPSGRPRFVKTYLDLRQSITQAVQDYIGEVRTRTFPGPDQIRG
jgi:3-methyl-2-oxobutanoate hydroxymethyltransferase